MEEKRMSKKPNFQEFVDELLERSSMEEVVWKYKDGTMYRQPIKEFVLWFKSELVAGMFGDHRGIMERLLVK